MWQQLRSGFGGRASSGFGVSSGFSYGGGVEWATGAAALRLSPGGIKESPSTRVSKLPPPLKSTPTSNGVRKEEREQIKTLNNKFASFIDKVSWELHLVHRVGCQELLGGQVQTAAMARLGFPAGKHSSAASLRRPDVFAGGGQLAPQDCGYFPSSSLGACWLPGSVLMKFSSSLRKPTN